MFKFGPPLPTAPVPAHLERTPEPVDWEQLEAPKQQALQRVERRSMEQFDQWSESQSEGSSPFGLRLLPLATASAALGLALLLWLKPFASPTPPTSWPSLQTQGHGDLRWQPGARQSELQVKVPAARSIQLAEKGFWSLHSQGGSELLLKRRSRKHLQVELRRGAVVAQVRPGSMKGFVVHCARRWKVVVKGTVFAVRQGPDWLRVEVMRGRVQVQRPGLSPLRVEKGQGIRWDHGRRALLRYPVYRQTQTKLAPLMRWMRAHAPQQLLAYARDIASQKEWASQHRRSILELLANLLARQRQHHQASRLWLQLYRSNPKGFEGQTALFQAAQHCRKHGGDTRPCVALYRQWLQRFPKGMSHLHGGSLFGLLKLLKAQKAPASQLRPLIREYLKRHPKGIHRRSIQGMLR